jgi:hypothetical protein
MPHSDDSYQAVYSTPEELTMEAFEEYWDQSFMPPELLYERYKHGIQTGLSTYNPNIPMYDYFSGTDEEYRALVESEAEKWAEGANPVYDYGETEDLTYEEWTDKLKDDWLSAIDLSDYSYATDYSYDFTKEKFWEKETEHNINQLRKSQMSEAEALSRLKSKSGFASSYIGQDFDDDMVEKTRRESNTARKQLKRRTSQNRDKWLSDVYDTAKDLVITQAFPASEFYPEGEFEDVGPSWSRPSSPGGMGSSYEELGSIYLGKTSMGEEIYESFIPEGFSWDEYYGEAGEGLEKMVVDVWYDMTEEERDYYHSLEHGSDEQYDFLLELQQKY